MRRLRPLPLVVVLLVLAATAACRRAGGDAEIGDSGFRGIHISPPREKPDFTLTDVNGAPFNLRTATAGKVTLLFFGYTHCPDVCPLHVANVAAVMRRMPFEEREAIRFVFVTTDPARDTPERLKAWLANFDPTFIGVTGSEEEVNRILYSLQMPPIQKDPAATDSARYLVGHAAQVVAFDDDGYARLEYPFGIRQEDWAHDLPRLARGERARPPAAAVGGQLPGGRVALTPLPSGDEPPVNTIRIAAAIVPRPASLDEGALYLVLRNAGAQDTLLSVWSEIATRAEVHETAGGDGGGMQHMHAVPHVVVGERETLQLVPGGTHVMLLGLKRLPDVEESVPVRLRFARAGEVILAAMVVDYADVERLLTTAVTTLAP